MDKIWNKYPEIKQELVDVLNLMKSNVKCKDKKIENSIIELIESGGKLLRPAFVLIGSKFGEYDREKSIPTAAVIEMLHMATLVHDDVIDDSKLRRGQETIQSKYGKDYAVYIGDYLFCICFKILATNASLQAIKVDSRAMSKICMGEVNQLNSRFSMNLSVKDYLSRISGKTAELFSISLYLGAAECNANTKISRELRNIGHNLGMAFQIIDDILDYEGNDESIKKSAANDLKQGIYTLPLIYAYKKDKNAFDNILAKDFYTEEEVSKIIELVKKNNGIENAKELAEKYMKKCFKGIDRLPENEYKYILRDIAEWLLLRTY
ncbi:Heptaprenyl diphosphate synthase component 2 [bioreactor metagenome]|jgi:heptaprenyl diphosphate synthase|uniref:Trans-hexaprenyltranstransferase n=2 Tax=root TaxID=1 RepID=R9BT72_9CLOT|nr:polyprenyl synthetase family protein [Clostridium sartagoforme]EOR20268.1 trans-hexaprenyltranstransferase [Clostridium sartagoforme AAU1]